MHNIIHALLTFQGRVYNCYQQIHSDRIYSLVYLPVYSTHLYHHLKHKVMTQRDKCLDDTEFATCAYLIECLYSSKEVRMISVVVNSSLVVL